MWRRDLLKNKLYAMAIIFSGALSVPVEWDVTFFLFALMVGSVMFFSRENWIMQGSGFMGRAEIRRAMKNERKTKTATYNLTRAQLDAMIREKIGDELRKVGQQATDDVVNTTMILLLTLSLQVLMDHYGTKSYAKRIPEFTDYALDYYEKWQNGELDVEELKEDLWKYGGVRLKKTAEV